MTVRKHSPESIGFVLEHPVLIQLPSGERTNLSHIVRQDHELLINSARWTFLDCVAKIAPNVLVELSKNPSLVNHVDEMARWRGRYGLTSVPQSGDWVAEFARATVRAWSSAGASVVRSWESPNDGPGQIVPWNGRRKLKNAERWSIRGEHFVWLARHQALGHSYRHIGETAYDFVDECFPLDRRTFRAGSGSIGVVGGPGPDARYRRVNAQAVGASCRRLAKRLMLTT